MRTQELKLANRTFLVVVMEETTINLEEVIAIGYGVQRKSVITGAIASISAGSLMTSSITRAENALQGKSSGVQVISNSGAPGANVKVRVRGYSSNGASDPLYIVDGVRATSIRNLDPNDIMNIEVLKDAAAAAIYGAEGGNGVVLITTRNGKPGEGQITYNFQRGWQSLAQKPSLMDSYQFAEFMTEAGQMNNPAFEYNTDWVGEIFTVAPFDKHHVAFTGGREKGSFMLSLSYLNQDGIVEGLKDRFKRYTVMFNSEYRINNWLKVGHNVSYANTKLSTVSENSEYGSVISNAMMADPMMPVSYQGTLPSHVQYLLDQEKKLLKDEQGNYYGISKWVIGEINNPFVTRDASSVATGNDLLFGNIFADFTPLKKLTITSRLGFNLMANDSRTYNQEFYYNSVVYNNISNISNINTIGRYWQFENFATWSEKIQQHNLTILTGMSASESSQRYVQAFGGPLTSDQVEYAELSFLASQASDFVSGTTTKTRKLSYFGRLSYDFDDKYILQTSLRSDAAGEDILPPENRWGLFPSFSAGWILSNEKFFPKSVFNYAKLRVSWGQNGSISNLGNYQYSSALTSSAIYPIKEDLFYVATSPAGLSNRELTWETSEQLNVGIDLRLFHDKLAVTVDVYNKKTKDLITTNTPPLESGNTAAPINAGNVINRGTEIDLSYRDRLGQLHYSIEGNLSTLYNMVTYLNPTVTRLNGTQVNLWYATAFEKGFPIWYFRGYKTDGIDPVSGDPKFVDTDGTSGITVDDQTYIGSAIPSLTFGGNIDLKYKNFDFKLVGQGQSGNQILMGLIRSDRPVINKLTYFYDQRWTPSNTEAKMPKAAADARSWNSDLIIFDGIFLKIKQIQLGYNVEANLIRKIKMKSARIYLSLDDFFTFAKYPGMDPEAGSVYNNSLGIDRGMYPNAKKIMIGATVNF